MGEIILACFWNGNYPPLTKRAKEVEKGRCALKESNRRLMQLFNNQKGLTCHYFDDLCDFYGFQQVNPPRQAWTVEMIFGLLAKYGPLFLAAAVNSAVYHAVVAVGADTTHDWVYLNDP